MDNVFLHVSSTETLQGNAEEATQPSGQQPDVPARLVVLERSRYFIFGVCFSHKTHWKLVPKLQFWF